MDKTAKIFIAGHRGMVGSAIHRKLISHGFKNFVLRNSNELNLTRQSETESFFEKENPEYVFLAAAKVGGILANDKLRAQFIYENLMIQNNVIHASWKSGVRKLLFLGSSCIYPKFAEQPMKEEYLLTGPLEPTNEPYAVAKIAGIKMCENYFRQYGSDFISVMPTNLYGENDNYDLEKSHVLPALIRKIHLGKCLENNDMNAIREDLNKRPIDSISGNNSENEILKILSKFGINSYTEPNLTNPAITSQEVSIDNWGTGNVFREFLHVDDMAEACIHIMNHISSQKLYVELKQTHINIGTGIDLTIRELAESISQIVGFNGTLLWDRSKPDGTPKKQLDISLAKKLNWQPKIGLTEGIRSVYANYLKY